MIPVAVSKPPSVVRWFKVYLKCIAGIYVALLVTGVVLMLVQPASITDDWAGTTLIISPLLGLGLIYVLGHLPPLLGGRRPWVWRYSLVLLCLGLVTYTLLVCLPLLIFWLKPEVKAYYGKE